MSVRLAESRLEQALVVELFLAMTELPEEREQPQECKNARLDPLSARKPASRVVNGRALQGVER